MAQCAAKFEILGRFPPFFINNPTQKIRRFVKRVKPSLQNSLVIVDLLEFNAVVRIALLVEQNLAKTNQVMEAKKKKDHS